jgi:chromosomal replication initiator protein
MMVSMRSWPNAPRCCLFARISKSQALGLEVGDDVLGFVATMCKGNVRVVEGALNALLAVQQLEGPVSPERARKALCDLVGGAAIQVTPETISGHAARAYGIAPSTLYSRTRKRDVVEARQLAMYLTRQHTQHTLKRIGNHFRRDHSTVVYACNVVEGRLGEPHYAHMVAKIERSLGELRGVASSSSAHSSVTNRPVTG